MAPVTLSPAPPPPRPVMADAETQVRGEEGEEGEEGKEGEEGYQEEGGTPPEDDNDDEQDDGRNNEDDIASNLDGLDEGDDLVFRTEVDTLLNDPVFTVCIACN